ncbi:Uncharacterised protein (plasmid) [Tsukamurella tyrosinosolvens]|uniref:Uncharacterized protein n=1 Tax=Tsukamurella tyrosinosolvens TaxID=57704 RepID=A0A1H4UB25_TSUTY|nr:hypothetical protein [Tsukamurella tyrosinosolvens]KXO92986.1 hypothetical protein AXK58_14040 [Tsukamurella tyrosinosolvens]SEC65568.1 hypothetical protein SAMN04489793_2829 [Tsukamurella tyrosinosolvens]VEH94083.1 Uncharacterised protein [Tsukamurella tyrosinosolvens]
MSYNLTITEPGHPTWTKNDYDGDSTGDLALFHATGRLRELGAQQAEIDALHERFATELATGSGDVFLAPGTSFTGHAGRFGVEIVRN